MRIHSTPLALLLTLAVATPALAKIEITPTLAYRGDDFSQQDPRIACLTTPCDFPVETDDGAAYGIVASFGFADRWAVEVLANRGSSDLGGSDAPAFDFEVQHLQAGVAHTWGDGALRPYVAAAAGRSQVESDAFPGRDRTEEAFSWSAGAGVKVRLSELLALRLEARGYRVDLEESLGGGFTQQELSAGLTFRF